MENLSSKELAECVGLWLAEGDRKTKSEITFTNNCTDLIDLFYKTLINLFKDKKENVRIYIYSKENDKTNLQYKEIITKHYLDKRARKPYYILRLASVEYTKKWKEIVKDISDNKKLYPFILRGFFAGEGNIKESSKASRILRIAQKEPNLIIESILKFLGLTFSFRARDRSYYLYGKLNWDIFAELKLADLHPDKKEKFLRIYNNFKQDHYKNNYLRDSIFIFLETPQTTRALSKKYNRSFARIQDILIDLKKKGKIKNFRVGSIDYWTNNHELIIISKIKSEYLAYLNESKNTSDFAKKFNVDSKSSLKILKGLQRLNLVNRSKDKVWSKMSINEGNLLIK